MKNYLVLAFALVSFLSNAQNVPSSTASVERSFFSAQFGLINFSFHNETRIARKAVLHSEMGLELIFSDKEDIQTKNSRTITIIAPYISFEPRYYYNLDRRFNKSKNIKGNSANYFSLKTIYQANDNPVIKNRDLSIVPYYAIIPKYGIRRSFAKQFNYEFSGGIGYQYNIFSSSKGCNCGHDSTTLDLQARVGYNF